MIMPMVISNVTPVPVSEQLKNTMIVMNMSTIEDFFEEIASFCGENTVRCGFSQKGCEMAEALVVCRRFPDNRKQKKRAAGMVLPSKAYRTIRL